MSIILAILALSILVFFHEIGHFISAKISGVKVEEFGFGYPPRIFGISKKNRKTYFFWRKKIPEEAKEATIYSLNLIPFGGFNRLKGEIGESKELDSFEKQKWYKKVFVSSSGALMNLVLAFFVFFACFLYGMPQVIEEGMKGKLLQEVGVQIVMVMPDSPAQKAGLKNGDVIVKINEKEIISSEEAQKEIHLQKEKQKIKLTLKRGGEIIEKEAEVLPISQIFPEIKENYGAIGISLAQIGIVRYSLSEAIVNSFKTTVSLTTQLFYGLWLILKYLFIKREMIGQLVGPIGITAMMGQAARIGFSYFLQLVGLLSMAIGLCQLIPFPALDGFRVLTSFLEGIRKKPIKPQVEATIINLGFFLLLFLMIFITSKEIIGLIRI